MTELDKLKHFMKPYYQTDDDETLLNDYLTEYTYAVCAASALWYELAGEVGLNQDGLQQVDTGAEKFKYSEPGTIQLACTRQAAHYEKRCNAINKIGSCSVKVIKAPVAGIEDISDY